MFYVNVWLTLKDLGDGPRVADALKRTGERSRKEAGCERWEAYHSLEDPSRFLLVEHWTTRDHWETHRAGDAVQQIYLKEVIPHVVREAHPSDLIG